MWPVVCPGTAMISVSELEISAALNGDVDARNAVSVFGSADDLRAVTFFQFQIALGMVKMVMGI